MTDHIRGVIEEDSIRIKESNNREHQKRIEKVISKSKGAGDSYHNKAVQMGAVDDYLEGDHGEAPQGAR